MDTIVIIGLVIILAGVFIFGGRRNSYSDEFSGLFYVAVVLGLAFWGTVGYIVLHFIVKFW